MTHRFPKTCLEGKFSIEYLLWLVLSKGSVESSDFSEEKSFTDFREFAQKISRFSDLPSDDSTRPIRLIIRSNHQIIFDQLVQYPKGTPQNPLSSREHFAKYHQLTQGKLDAIYWQLMEKTLLKLSEFFEKITLLD